MTVEAISICVGRCYLTHKREVWKVLEIEGDRVTYIVRGKLAFPAWDREMWRVTTTDTFAKDVEREVPCDCLTP